MVDREVDRYNGRKKERIEKNGRKEEIEDRIEGEGKRVECGKNINEKIEWIEMKLRGGERNKWIEIKGKIKRIVGIDKREWLSENIDIERCGKDKIVDGIVGKDGVKISKIEEKEESGGIG